MCLEFLLTYINNSGTFYSQLFSPFFLQIIHLTTTNYIITNLYILFLGKNYSVFSLLLPRVLQFVKGQLSIPFSKQREKARPT